MNALELLREQHEEVMDLFSQIEETEDPVEKEDLVQALTDNLAAHSTIEERLFYPAAYSGATKELLAEARDEHLAVKRLLVDLLSLTPDDESFDAKITVLKEQVEHHVEEEEMELFPIVRLALRPETLKELGDQMEDMFNTEMNGDPANGIPDQVFEAAPQSLHEPLSERR